jgi:glycosyltransferase involved in cell wall biosynthesis
MSERGLETGGGRLLSYLCQQATRQGQASYAHVHEIIGGLSRRGWEVKLFQPGYTQRDRSPSLVIRLPEMVRAEIDLVRAKPLPDVVYMRSHLCSNIVARWCVRRCIPFVEEVNGSASDAGTAHPVLRPLIGLTRRASAWRWTHAAGVIAVTPGLKDMVNVVAPRAIVHVVPNGANTNLFRPALSQVAPLPGLPYVIFFGALAPWQDLETMLSAIGLPQWPTGVRLVILGSGEQASFVQDAATRSNCIVYIGPVPYTDVPHWVGHALAALSLQRSLSGRSASGLSPLKLYESMACAVPVIVSEAPGQGDLVREARSGLVIPEADPVALAAAVAQLREHPDESARMGERGRRVVELGHSWDIRAEQTHQILSHAVAGKVGTQKGVMHSDVDVATRREFPTDRFHDAD